MLITLIYWAKNIEALLVASKDVGLEVNAEKTRCTRMFESCKQNVGQKS
jgi:hypothetical protein